MPVPPGDPGSYKSPFFRDFIHHNVTMMTSNNALVPDPDKQDDLASQFWQWPILNVGLRMCSWDDNSKASCLRTCIYCFFADRNLAVKYFLLVNPFVYWVSTASLAIFGLMV